MALLKFIILMLFIVGCSNNQTIQNIIHEKYIDKNTSIKNLDKYSKVLDKKQSKLFNNKLTGNYKSISWVMLKNDFLYIRIYFFDVNTANTLKIIVHKNVMAKGIILDLRDNHGGILDTGIEISDLFLDTGLIIKTKNNNGKYLYYDASNATTITDKPLVILINKQTASASEIVAGSLQKHHRTLLIGSPTYGKRAIQEVIHLDNKKILKLTVEKYFFSGENKIIHKKIIPNIQFIHKKFILSTNDTRVQSLYNSIRQERKRISSLEDTDHLLLLAVTLLEKVPSE